jgi:hypothetical protein
MKISSFYFREDKMASKSKEVRLEQRRVLEQKLEMRLKKLEEAGAAKEKIAKDAIAKNLRAQIKEANMRIAAIDKNTTQVENLRQAKQQKLAEKAAEVKEPKKKKQKEAPEEKESKKKKTQAPQAPQQKKAAKK